MQRNNGTVGLWYILNSFWRTLISSNHSHELVMFLSVCVTKWPAVVTRKYPFLIWFYSGIVCSLELIIQFSAFSLSLTSKARVFSKLDLSPFPLPCALLCVQYLFRIKRAVTEYKQRYWKYHVLLFWFCSHFLERPAVFNAYALYKSFTLVDRSSSTPQYARNG